MSASSVLYEGKAKIIYATPETHVLRMVYKDSATAFNKLKQAEFKGKGQLNCAISSAIFKLLETKQIPTHFIKQCDEVTCLVKAVQILPLEVVVRNVTAGSMVKRLGVPAGQTIYPPLVEFYYKKDELGDPLITEDQAVWMKLATHDDLSFLKQEVLRLNHVLMTLFETLNLTLVDFKVEYGQSQGQWLLADEISPDTCRLWDRTTGESLDKDVFRQDTGDLLTSYREVETRMKNKGYL